MSATKSVIESDILGSCGLNENTLPIVPTELISANFWSPLTTLDEGAFFATPIASAPAFTPLTILAAGSSPEITLVKLLVNCCPVSSDFLVVGQCVILPSECFLFHSFASIKYKAGFSGS